MCLPFQDLILRSLGKGEHLGFEWEVVVNAAGYRCGYVRVLPGHPWFETDYQAIGADAHGGLTFGAHGKSCNSHDGKDEWWVGFDTAHCDDAPDPALREHPALRPRDNAFEASALLHEKLGYSVIERGIVRTQAYVEDECRSLCEQAYRAARGGHLTVTAERTLGHRAAR